MPAIAVHDDQVLSKTGSGRNCQAPIKTSVGACQTGMVGKVKIGGQLIVVEGDVVGDHSQGGCSTDPRKLKTFSSKVRVGGKGVGRIGDVYGDDADNIITQGSSKVFGA